MSQELFSLNVLAQTYASLFLTYLPSLITAILVLVVGLWIAGKLTSYASHLIAKRDLDPSLQSFLGGLIGVILKVCVFLAAVEVAGVKTTSFIAILGAAGLAVGLALQGSLSNFAGGVVLLVFKPFKTGDYIIAQGEEGTVQKIDIFHTWLNKFDNRRVILPNGPLASGTIVNVTAEKIRRVDVNIGISYDSDITLFREKLTQLAKDDPRVLPEPAPFVGITDFGDSSVNFTFRIWCEGIDFWPLTFDMREKVKSAIDKEDVLDIPFPRRDVHLFKQDS